MCFLSSKLCFVWGEYPFGGGSELLRQAMGCCAPDSEQAENIGVHPPDLREGSIMAFDSHRYW